MSVPTRRILAPIFGNPTLAAANNGTAAWDRGATSPLDQKGSTGWLAKLYGGVQTGDDWARVNIPVDDIPVTDFKTAKWSYYMTGTQTMGVNIVIWVHDHDDFDNRAEITQLGGHADLEKSAGWNAFEFTSATGGMFFYGEGTTGTGLTAGTQYTWAQFQADALFMNWTIYRITLEYGWEASGTFDYVWVADVQMNGQVIHLKPTPVVDSSGHIILGANSGVDIGDVDVTSIVPGTAATNLGKAEDAAHTSSDTGVMALSVRKDMPGTLASATGDYTPEQTDAYGNIRTVDSGFPMFGLPELRHDNEGWGQWESKALQAKYKDSYDTNRHFRYGNWAVHLNGGPQASEESWASVSVPIKGMRVQDVTSISYDWYAQYNGSAHILDIGPNLVFSAYDPDNHAARVDFNTYGIDNNIFMADGLANRPVEAGWYKYIMTSTDATERVYYYADNDGAHTPCVTDGADYYWSQYIVDTVFKNWIIYRVQIMIGYWGATRSTGDVWIGNMKINGIPVKWEPSEAEKVEIYKRDAERFGRPTLTSRNNGRANWERGSTSPLDQKSSTGWLARLYGGVQSSWDDYARLEIPVKEMRIPDLKTVKWSYYMTEAESFGINMVVFAHDPFNPDNRAEITQQADIATLIKAAGWNAHVLDPSVDQFYFYGEGTTNTNLTTAPPNYYGWDDFVADELFNTWTIYKITFDNGWQSGDNEFKNAFIADVEINGVMIPLGPASGKHSKTVTQSKTLVGGANSAFDVLSESIDAGTDWDFDFGGTGKIVDAVLTIATTALTAETSLHCFCTPPTCVLNDNVANTSPVAADVPHFKGAIELPALRDYGTTSLSYTHASLSTSGGLPIRFDSPIVNAVLISVDAMTPGNVLCTISLTADMED